MHRKRVRRVVLEHHANRVSYFGAQDWTKEPEMFPFRRARLQGCEGLVGILAVQRLAIGGADPVWAALGEHLRISHKVHPHHFVDAGRRIVPVHFIGGYVIGMNASGRFFLWEHRNSKQANCQRREKTTLMHSSSAEDERWLN
jgi:hypothetical protein